MIVVTVTIGFLIAAGISLLATALISNAKDVSDNRGLPRIKFKEFKESFVWVNWKLYATKAEYRGRYQWETFTFRYWDLLRYKIWKSWCETKVAVEDRREEEQFKLKMLREEIEEKKKKSGRG